MAYKTSATKSVDHHISRIDNNHTLIFRGFRVRGEIFNKLGACILCSPFVLSFGLKSLLSRVKNILKTKTFTHIWIVEIKNKRKWNFKGAFCAWSNLKIGCVRIFFLPSRFFNFSLVCTFFFEVFFRLPRLGLVRLFDWTYQVFCEGASS